MKKNFDIIKDSTSKKFFINKKEIDNSFVNLTLKKNECEQKENKILLQVVPKLPTMFSEEYAKIKRHEDKRIKTLLKMEIVKMTQVQV